MKVPTWIPLIVFLCLSICFVSPQPCFRATYSNLNFTGDAQSSSQTCVRKCEEFKYSVLFTPAYCFCANSVDTSKEEVCENVACSKDDICMSNNMRYINNSQSFKIVDFQTENLVLINKETVISVKVDRDRNNVSLRFNFGNEFWSPYSLNSSINHTFLTPGMHSITVEAANPYTQSTLLKKWVNVEALIEASYEFPKVYETGVNGNAAVLLLKGTNASLHVEVEQNGLKNTYSLKADVYVSGFGPPSHEISTTVPLQALYGSGPFLFIPTSLAIRESGSMTSVEVLVTKTGVLSLLILRPICPSGTYCFKKQACNCKDNRTLYGRATTLPVGDFVNDIEVEVVQKILLNATQKGYNMLNINSHKLYVKKGDMVAYYGATGYAALSWIPGEHNTYRYSRVSNEVGDRIQISKANVTNTNKQIALRVYISKSVVFDILLAPMTNIGEIKFDISISSPLNVERESRTIQVQDRIEGLQFALNKPKVSSEGGYPLSTRWYEVEAIISKGSHVTYLFTIPSLNVTKTSDDGKAIFEIYQVGDFDCHVRAFNLINEMNTSVRFSVEAAIKGQHVLLSKSAVTVGETVTVFVNVINGTKVELLLDFGDGKTVDDFLHDAHGEDGVFHNYTHLYSQCNRYLITAKVKNSISPGETWESFPTPFVDSVNVSISCPLTFVNVSTQPIPTDKGVVLLSLASSIELEVSLNSGSWPTYHITWGDNTTETITNQVMEINPKTFLANHQYISEGNYTIQISVSNPIGSIKSSNITVSCKKCTAPPVAFTYGTESNPTIFTRGNTKTFTAQWEYDTGACKDSGAFQFKYWQLTFPNGSYIKDTNIRTTENQLSYTIEKGSLNEGEYELTLSLMFHSDELQYKAYIRIIASPIIAQIQNGQFQSIPYKKRVDVNETFYNFTIDASLSYDPDDVTKKTEGMSLEWFCRIVSNDSETNASRAAKNEVLNKTYDEVCVSKNWKLLNKVEFRDTSNEIAVLHFNTEMFLEGVTYEFRVNITKDSRKASFVQRVYFVTGAPPHVKINCKANCLQKLNPMERLIFKYECQDCPPNKILIGNWKVYSGSKDITGGLQNRNVSSTGTWQPNLVINPPFLLESTEYKFYLKVGYAGEMSQSEYHILKLTSGKPKDGSCAISPTEGIASRDDFRIKCINWVNDDQPTFYEFRYDDRRAPGTYMSSTQSMDYPLLNPHSLDAPELSKILLPAGDPKKNYSLALKIRIINKYGAYYEYNDLFVKVTLPEHASTNETSILNDVLKSEPNRNDTQYLSNYVMSTMSVVNHEADYVNSKKVESKVDYTNQEDPEAFENAEIEKENFRNEQKKVVTKMINYLDRVSVASIQDIKTVGDALMVATTDSATITDQSKDDAVNIISKLGAALSNLSKEESVGNYYVEQSAKPMLACISNLVKTDISEVKISRDGSTSPRSNASDPGEKASKQAKQSKRTMDKLVGTLDSYLTLVANKKVPGEIPSIGRTETFSFAVQREAGARISNMNISTDSVDNADGINYGFSLPNSDDMFPDDILGKEISIQSFTFNDNIFSWDSNSSLHVKSKVTSLAFKTGGDVVQVKNTKEPIRIKIQNNLESFQSRNVTLFMPEETKIETLELKSLSCNLLVNIEALNDFKDETRLIVYIQYGKPPTTVDHDVMLNISKANITLNKNHGFVNITGNLEDAKNVSNLPVNNTNRTVTKQRHSNVRMVDETTLMMWNFNESTYGQIQNARVYFSFSYIGPMPDRILQDNIYTYDVLESRGSFNYSLKSFCSECRYWDEANDRWQNDGCELDIEESSLVTTSCQCNHLTSFGGFYVAPNPLPTPSLALLKEGYVLLVTVATILLLYVVGLIFARRADLKDQTKIGVCPLPDNRIEDKYLYEITVNTGTRRNAGTKSNVYVTVVGDSGESGFRSLKDSERKTFQRGSSDVFIMSTESCLGDLTYIRIWHDNSDGGWFLRSVEIIDLQTEDKYFFLATRWLAVDQHDGQVDCVVPVCSKEELTNFNYLFTSKTRRDFSDTHIWYSVYARPARSPFTRCQRLSVAISLLFSVMLASVMFYGTLPEGNPAEENKIGSFNFTWKQVYIAIISTCITVPINLILAGIFRSVRPASTQKLQSTSVETLSEESFVCHSPRSEKLLIGEPAKRTSVHVNMHEDATIVVATKPKTAGKKKKEPFYLPHWCIYFAWLLCVVVILGCGCLIVLYGMAFGNKKSLDWLASVSISLVQDIFLIQPLKVFVMALFIALIVKKIEEEEKSPLEKQVKVLAKNEKWLHKLANETTIFDRVDTSSLKPPDTEEIEGMRSLRYKEAKMYAVSRELILYLIFAAIVFVIGFITRDHSAYHQTRDIEELLRLHVRKHTNFVNKKNQSLEFKQLTSYEDFWPWAEDMLLEQLYPSRWYNLSNKIENKKKKDFPGKIYLNDLSSKILNGVRIRQVRVKRDSCQILDSVKGYMTIDCADEYGVIDEETQDFNFNWSLPISTKARLTPVNKPWRYQTWKALDSYPIWAKLGTYYGGGYVVEIFPKWDNAMAIKTLKDKRWIDRHTRAVIVEFTLYNPSTNYFDSVTIVFEFPASGGIIHWYSVVTFKLYRYTSGYAFLTISCEVLFVLFMLLFFIREIRLLYKSGVSYFYEFWNLVEMSNFILSVLAVAFYFYRDKLANDLLNRIPGKTPDRFINFQFAAYWDMTFTYIVALICFFVMLKFIKMLRFNKRISMLSSTLKAAWYPLSMFGIIFGIVILAVVTSSKLIFGTSLYGYRNAFSATASIISLLLGKFSYYQFENTNRVLGPIFFFFFNIMVNWIIMNMFISILTDVFADVQADLLMQDNDYEILDFMMDHFKSWIGFKSSKRETLVQNMLHSNQLKPRSSSLRSNESNISTDPNTNFRKSSMKRNDSGDINGELLNSREHSLFQQNTDFLKEEKMEDSEVNEIVNKFMTCVNILYFDEKRK